MRKYFRLHYQENRAKKLEYQRRWREENMDKSREAIRRWNEANPAKRAESQRRRRANKKGVQNIHYTTEELEARLSMFGGRCWMCGGPAVEIDHLIPLDRGGPHCLSNLRPACRSCNASKSTKTPSEMSLV